jgi:uncharacterized protein with HEPN domain
MPRDYRVYLDDILEAAGKIEEYIEGYTRREFVEDSRTVDAVIRNLMVIGEAANHVPDEVRTRYPAAQWRDMIGLRNIVVHEYFGVNLDVIWKIVQNDLPQVRVLVKKILGESP